MNQYIYVAASSWSRYWYACKKMVCSTYCIFFGLNFVTWFLKQYFNVFTPQDFNLTCCTFQCQRMGSISALVMSHIEISTDLEYHGIRLKGDLILGDGSRSLGGGDQPVPEAGSSGCVCIWQRCRMLRDFSSCGIIVHRVTGCLFGFFLLNSLFRNRAHHHSESVSLCSLRSVPETSRPSTLIVR